MAALVPDTLFYENRVLRTENAILRADNLALKLRADRYQQSLREAHLRLHRVGLANDLEYLEELRATAVEEAAANHHVGIRRAS